MHKIYHIWLLFDQIWRVFIFLGCIIATVRKVRKKKQLYRKGDVKMKEMFKKVKKVLLDSLEMFAAAYYSNSIYRPF